MTAFAAGHRNAKDRNETPRKRSIGLVNRRWKVSETITEPPGVRRRCGRLPHGNSFLASQPRLTGPDARPGIRRTRAAQPPALTGYRPAGTLRVAGSRLLQRLASPRCRPEWRRDPPDRSVTATLRGRQPQGRSKPRRARCDEHRDARHPPVHSSGCSGASQGRPILLKARVCQTVSRRRSGKGAVVGKGGAELTPPAPCQPRGAQPKRGPRNGGREWGWRKRRPHLSSGYQNAASSNAIIDPLPALIARKQAVACGSTRSKKNVAVFSLAS